MTQTPAEAAPADIATSPNNLIANLETAQNMAMGEDILRQKFGDDSVGRETYIEEIEAQTYVYTTRDGETHNVGGLVTLGACHHFGNMSLRMIKLNLADNVEQQAERAEDHANLA
jgi:hypothetical protein